MTQHVAHARAAGVPALTAVVGRRHPRRVAGLTTAAGITLGLLGFAFLVAADLLGPAVIDSWIVAVVLLWLARRVSGQWYDPFTGVLTGLAVVLLGMLCVAGPGTALIGLLTVTTAAAVSVLSLARHRRPAAVGSRRGR